MAQADAHGAIPKDRLARIFLFIAGSRQGGCTCCLWMFRWAAPLDVAPRPAKKSSNMSKKVAVPNVTDKARLVYRSSQGLSSDKVHDFDSGVEVPYLSPSCLHLNTVSRPRRVEVLPASKGMRRPLVLGSRQQEFDPGLNTKPHQATALTRIRENKQRGYLNNVQLIDVL